MRYYTIDCEEDEMRSRVPHPRPISAYGRCDTPSIFAGEAFLPTFTSKDLDKAARLTKKDLWQLRFRAHDLSQDLMDRLDKRIAKAHQIKYGVQNET